MRALSLVLFCIASAVGAQPEGPRLHEYISPDPEEDLRLQATTRDGSMPAAIETRSGVVTAPRSDRSSESQRTAYGGTSTPDSTDATYRVDRDTSRPDWVGYDDPFTPAVTPFKRLFAYDAVDESLELIVSDKKLSKIEIGTPLELGDDQFFADMFVDLAEGTPVRIPTPGPMARVLALRTEPPTKLELLRDGGDNWFALASVRRRVRLVMQLAVPRAVFGSRFANVSFSTLGGHVARLPPQAKASARRVLGKLGLSQRLGPQQALDVLVAHFRSFSASEELPRATTGAALYEELSLSKKGVCRHRAYAFVVTALALDIPARLIRNEAHAWVEVYDGSIWHRIDLGGAASRLEYAQDDFGQGHVPPADPFSWPEGSESGQSMAERASAAQSSGAGSTSSANRPPGAEEWDVTPGLPGPDSSEASLELQPAELILDMASLEIGRGGALRVRGRVMADGAPCRSARVDVALGSGHDFRRVIGALPSGEDGMFDGDVTVPLSVDVGDYVLSVSTPGTPRCGPSAE